MPLHVEFQDDELPDLQKLLLRALNTWEPADAPKWAFQLDASVVARINYLKNKEKANEQQDAGSGHLDQDNRQE